LIEYEDYDLNNENFKEINKNFHLESDAKSNIKENNTDDRIDDDLYNQLQSDYLGIASK